jgi:uncharacterized membrane protein
MPADDSMLPNAFGKCNPSKRLIFRRALKRVRGRSVEVSTLHAEIERLALC